MILPEIQKALEKSFVKWEKVGEVLSLAWTLKKPCILYGKGGHGKSEMVRAAFSALSKNQEDTFILSFGEGMTEAKLFGGVNLKALNDVDNPRLRFCTEESFLPKKLALFEELFDAPPVVLMALKDTLMDRKLNNGTQVVPMETELLVAATNKDPREISDLGDSAQALIERFPLQLCVEWDNYKEKDFLELFNKVQSKSPVVLGSTIKGTLAKLIADAHEKGHWISPRQAIVCCDTIRASAILNKRDKASEDDLSSIKFIPGTETVLADMNESLQRIKRIAKAENQLCKVENEIQEQDNLLKNRLTPIKYLQCVKRLQNTERELNDLPLPDELVDRRDKARKRVQHLCFKAQSKAIEVTIG